MPHRAVMVYNGTGKGGVVILETRFPYGVYYAQASAATASSGGTAPWTTTATTTEFPLRRNRYLFTRGEAGYLGLRRISTSVGYLPAREARIRDLASNSVSVPKRAFPFHQK
jgi:hypothetical protein